MHLVLNAERTVRAYLSSLFLLSLVAVFCCVIPAQAQYVMGNSNSISYGNSQSSTGNLLGSVPTGKLSNEVLQLTLRDAVDRALKYNLGSIEGSENARLTRGQRLVALSTLLPEVSVGATVYEEQLNLTRYGTALPAGLQRVIGTYSAGSADVSVSQTLFSFESIQRFRAARNAEQAAQLSYQDVLDAVTLTVGNAYLQVVAEDSRIQAQQAQVRNAKALNDQARDEVEAGTAPRIDATRTEVQLHTEEYNLSIARNNFAVAKLNLSRAIGLP